MTRAERLETWKMWKRLDQDCQYSGYSYGRCPEMAIALGRTDHGEVRYCRKHMAGQLSPAGEIVSLVSWL